MPEETLDPGGPGGAGLGGVAARLDGMLEDRLRGLPTGRKTNRSCCVGEGACEETHVAINEVGLFGLSLCWTPSCHFSAIHLFGFYQ